MCCWFSWSASNWHKSGSGSGQKHRNVDDSKFGHPDPEQHKEGNDQGLFVDYVLYGWVTLDMKELLAMFLQVLSNRVSIDSSGDVPLWTGTSLIQCKRKKKSVNGDDEDSECNALIGEIRDDLKQSFKIFDSRAAAEQKRADASIFSGSVTTYNGFLEASNQNKAKLAEYKMHIMQMQAEDAPEEHMEPLLELISELFQTACEMKDSSMKLKAQCKHHLDRLELASPFNRDENSNDSNDN